MRTMDTDFYLITALVYLPPPAAPYPLLDRHFLRLRTAHAQLAREIPQSWCASRPFPDESRLLQVMDECVQMNGREKELRVSSTMVCRHTRGTHGLLLLFFIVDKTYDRLSRNTSCRFDSCQYYAVV